MARTVRLLLILTLLEGMLAVSRGYAQTADGPAATPEPEFLKTFPRPPDQPASLLAPPPPLGPPPPDLERPYFQLDPLLDPPALGAVGWFADVDIGILKPHLINQESLPVTFPLVSPPAVGNIPGIPPGVTSGQNFISPPMPATPLFDHRGSKSRLLELDRLPSLRSRLPAGVGLQRHRPFLSEPGRAGIGRVIGADGPATLSSRLNANVIDLDWVSNEYTPRRRPMSRLMKRRRAAPSSISGPRIVPGCSAPTPGWT